MQVSNIKDQRGRAIGIKHQYTNGRVEIRLTNGRLLGWYDPANDRTISARTGNFIGEGDQTIGLLYDAL